MSLFFNYIPLYTPLFSSEKTDVEFPLWLSGLSVLKDVGSIPSLIQWVDDPALP